MNTSTQPSAAVPPPGPLAGSRPRSSVANAAWNTLGTLCTIAVSFFTAPVLIRSLGNAQYGTFLLVGSITGVLSLMNFGLGEATLRYVARYYGEDDINGVNRVFGSTLSFYALMSAVVSVVLWVSAPLVTSQLDVAPDQFGTVVQLVRMTGLVFSTRILTSVFSMVPSALQRYDISSKAGVLINVARTSGYLALAMLGYQVLYLVMWDLAVGLVSLVFWGLIARRMLPALVLLPSFSFTGLRETIGYSVFSFLTWGFHTMHRESGKLLLGRMTGTEAVGFLGAPDSMAQRLHMVVATGTEALIPTFSAGRDAKATATLYWNALWSALALSLILLIPFVVLVPDFLRLWISEEFARESGFAGQLLALYLISQGAFAPVAAYFRGTGKPGYVTGVILAALIITSIVSWVLIPANGVNGAAVAYLAGSAAPFVGVVAGGWYAFGRSASLPLLRTVGLPLVAGAVACALSFLVRGQSGVLSWFGFCWQGTVSVTLCTLLIVGSDWMLGGTDSPSRQAVERLIAHPRLGKLFRLLPLGRLGAQ